MERQSSCATGSTQAAANEQYISLYNAEDTAEAIRNMVVRGAPAIGIAAAYALVMAAPKEL